MLTNQETKEARFTKHKQKVSVYPLTSTQWETSNMYNNKAPEAKGRKHISGHIGSTLAANNW
eukprot:15682023-Heterocapsa_arctica.AAC.1